MQQELIKEKLLSDIDTKIKEFVKSSELDGVKALERYDPEKAAKILFLSASGKTQTQLVRKYLGQRHEHHQEKQSRFH